MKKKQKIFIFAASIGIGLLLVGAFFFQKHKKIQIAEDRRNALTELRSLELSARQAEQFIRNGNGAEPTIPASRFYGVLQEQIKILWMIARDTKGKPNPHAEQKLREVLSNIERFKKSFRESEN